MANFKLTLIGPRGGRYQCLAHEEKIFVTTSNRAIAVNGIKNSYNNTADFYVGNFSLRKNTWHQVGKLTVYHYHSNYFQDYDENMHLDRTIQSMKVDQGFKKTMDASIIKPNLIGINVWRRSPNKWMRKITNPDCQSVRIQDWFMAVTLSVKEDQPFITIDKLTSIW